MFARHHLATLSGPARLRVYAVEACGNEIAVELLLLVAALTTILIMGNH
jgi:hypothetical protein